MAVQELRIPLAAMDPARGSALVNLVREGDRLRVRASTQVGPVLATVAGTDDDNLRVATVEGGVSPYGLVRYKKAGSNGLASYIGNNWLAGDTEALTLAGEGDAFSETLEVAVIGTPALSLAIIAPGGARLRKMDLPTSGVLTGALAQFVPTVDGNAVTENVDHVGVLSPAGVPRLMVVTNEATFGTIGSDPSSIWLSDPANPSVFQSANRVRLRPGDGELVRAIVRWRDMTFVFKRTAFWVFTGEGELAPGISTFFRRPVEGVGLQGGSDCVTVAPDGVYFIGPGGLWRTTGGPPVYLGDPMRELFTAVELPKWGETWSFPVGDLAEYSRLVYADGRLFFTQATNTLGGTGQVGTATLVYDIASREWFIWTLPGVKFAFRDQLCAIDVNGNVATLDWNLATKQDFRASGAVSVFSAYWRGPWMDFGTQARKVIRNGRLIASTEVATPQGTYGIGVEHNPSPVMQAWSTLALGDTALLRTAYRGRFLQPLITLGAGADGIEALWLNVDGALPPAEPAP